MRVAEERSGWRDEELSRRHRTWGFHLPIIDIDFAVIHYDLAVPVALIEQKHERAKPVDLTSHGLRALATLATRANIPAFVARYADDFSWWEVTGINELALAIVPETRRVSEEQYVRFLYSLRDRAVPNVK